MSTDATSDITIAEVLALLDEAPIPSKYHGMQGFEEGRFLADYSAWMDKRRALVARARATPLKDALRVPHPSEFIREEMAARGWTVWGLARRMGDPEVSTSVLVLDLYFEAGPNNPELRIGEKDALALAKAFGVDPEFIRNLEKAWLASQRGDA